MQGFPCPRGKERRSWQPNLKFVWRYPTGSVVKDLPASAGDAGSIPGLGRSPWSKSWQRTPVFLPGKSHGQRSLAGYSPWGHESQTRLSDWTATAGNDSQENKAILIKKNKFRGLPSHMWKPAVNPQQVRRGGAGIRCVNRPRWPLSPDRAAHTAEQLCSRCRWSLVSKGRSLL